MADESSQSHSQSVSGAFATAPQLNIEGQHAMENPNANNEASVQSAASGQKQQMQSSSSGTSSKRRKLTMFLRLPHFDEQICRVLEVPGELGTLKKMLDVGPGQELVVNHPRFTEQFFIVEDPRQLFDGCNIKLIVPKRRVYAQLLASDGAVQSGGGVTG